MIYALTALLFVCLALAAAAAALSHVESELHGLQIPLASDF
jgi:hypothetical protein